MKVFKNVLGVIGVFGFMLCLGAAGASDCGKSITYILPYFAAGVGMIILAFSGNYIVDKLFK